MRARRPRSQRSHWFYVAFLTSVSWLPAADWPMLGGGPGHTLVSSEVGLPVEWDADSKSGQARVKWSAELGSTTFGSPVISDGLVFIGTNNDDPASKEKRGVLKCFSEKDGALRWRAVHEKLAAIEQDDSGIGICSTPCVAGGHVFYVSNRAEIVCRATKDGAVAWSLDMREKFGVTPNQASASSPLVVDDLVFVVTGHGANARTGVLKNPEAPSFLALVRQTGRVVWQDNSPGAKIITGQWGSAGYGVIDGEPQVIFPGGDGWLYSFEPKTGKPLWKFNCKAHETPGPGGKPETSFNLAAAPVVVGSYVFAAIGEPEAGSGPGALRCIDARKRGDVTATAELWRVGEKEFNDSLSMAAVHDGLVYATDTAGFLSCIDAASGKKLWFHDHLANIWGSPLVADGKVYVQTGEGTVNVFRAGREKKLLAKNSGLPDLGHGTPVAANGVLYITGQNKLWAIEAVR